VTGIGYPDWQPVVALSDNPQLISLGLNGQIPYSSAVIDVRRWASFVLSAQYEAPNVAPPQNTAIVRLRWWDSAGMGNEVARQDYEINSVNTVNCGRSLISDAMRGPFMSLDFLAGAGAASTLTYVLYGSNRGSDKTRATELGGLDTVGDSADRVPFLFRQNGLVAGLTKLATRLALGPATLSIGVGGAGGAISLRIYSPYLIGTGVAPTYITRTGMTGGFEVREQITLPRRVLVVELNNTGGTTPDFGMSIIVGDN
jgi:hypothetical protein